MYCLFCENFVAICLIVRDADGAAQENTSEANSSFKLHTSIVVNFCFYLRRDSCRLPLRLLDLTEGSAELSLGWV